MKYGPFCDNWIYVVEQSVANSEREGVKKWTKICIWGISTADASIAALFFRGIVWRLYFGTDY